MELQNLTDIFKEASRVVVTKDNNEYVINKGNDKFELILKNLYKVTENSNEMPAFGVSVDKLTKEQKKTGIWIEFEFDSEHWYGEMNFESLLMQVNKDFNGVNIIRKINGKYDGRCYYLNLSNTMEELYEVIKNMNLN